MFVLVIFLIIAAAAMGVSAIVGATRVALDKNKKALVASEKQVDANERVFRRIANGSGNPELEAQIALDEITNYHSKEIV